MPLWYTIIPPLAEDLCPKRLPIDHPGRVGSEYQSVSQKLHWAPGKLITGKKQEEIMRRDVQFFFNISDFLAVLKVFFNVEEKQRQRAHSTSNTNELEQPPHPTPPPRVAQRACLESRQRHKYQGWGASRSRLSPHADVCQFCCQVHVNAGGGFGDTRRGDNGTTTGEEHTPKRTFFFLRAPILHVNRCGPTLANKVGPRQTTQEGCAGFLQQPQQKRRACDSHSPSAG